MAELGPWLALFGLGAYHGINPAMGWLFAVALGLQEKNRRAVLLALPPIALGHAASIALVLGLLWLAQASLPLRALRYGAAALLFGFAAYRLIRARHPRWVGMRVNFADLVLWSFVMASAHGAGLMLIPIMLGSEAATHVGDEASAHAEHFSEQSAAFAGPFGWLAAVLVHTSGQFLAAALIALLVFEKLGLSILRRAWFNLDLIWAVALIASAAWVLLI